MKNVKEFPVMKKKCPTCPFKEDTPGRVKIANMVKARCITTASQICHHPALHGKKQDHLCRGARDYQIEIFHRIGFIDEQTDESWAKKLQEIKDAKKRKRLMFQS